MILHKKAILIVENFEERYAQPWKNVDYYICVLGKAWFTELRENNFKKQEKKQRAL